MLLFQNVGLGFSGISSGFVTLSAANDGDQAPVASPDKVVITR
jgi:hypothetical protein